MDFLSARRAKRDALVINDAQPLKSLDSVWAWSAHISVIGLFLMGLVAALYFGRPILLPVLAALVVGATVSPLIKAGQKIGLSPPLGAILLVVAMLAAVGIGVTLIATPLTEWIDRAPEIGATIRQKLYVLEWPLAALRDLRQAVMPGGVVQTVAVERGQVEMVAPVIAFVTPTVAQMLVFIGTLLFFLAGHQEIRARLAMVFTTRDAKLRFLRITNDIEHNLTGYLGVLTVINVALGAVVAFGAWLFGFSNPIIFGLMAAILNYLPYVGSAIMILILFGVGLVSFPTLGGALAPAVAFLVVTTIEGNFITPAIMGRRLTLNPLMVFLALAFWTWLWGPFGAFLAVPMTIVGLVVLNHIFPSTDGKLPD